MILETTWAVEGGVLYVKGNSGDDRLAGGPQGDTVDGGSGNDVVRGDSGGDVVIGGRGDDLLRGGGGRDRISGGSGKDRILARDSAVDRIVCGSKRDVVIADVSDQVGASCEVVRRR